jgi:hypothetical protein
MLVLPVGRRFGPSGPGPAAGPGAPSESPSAELTTKDADCEARESKQTTENLNLSYAPLVGSNRLGMLITPYGVSDQPSLI